MKKLLVVNDFDIDPPDHGGKVRIYNVYKELARKYDVTYVCYAKVDRPEEKKLDCGIRLVRIPIPGYHRFLQNIASGMYDGKSLDDIIAMELCRTNATLRQALEKYAKDADAVICSLPYMYPAVKRHINGHKLVYESHNVEPRMKRAILGGSLLSRLLCDRVKSVEMSLFRGADLVTATSEDDMKDLIGLYGRRDRIYISPNGTDVSQYVPKCAGIASRKRKTAIFIGSGHPPNAAAAKAVVNVMAPALPELDFLLLGGACHLVADDAKKRDNVKLAFFVSEEKKAELLAASDVALNPMTEGSGTNIKMLDYMAAGLPVITTPTGARGLNIRDGEQAIVCEADDFPAKIREALDHPEVCDRMGKSARAFVEESYDWKKIALNLSALLES